MEETINKGRGYCGEVQGLPGTTPKSLFSHCTDFQLHKLIK
jgi:hypothetical protein